MKFAVTFCVVLALASGAPQPGYFGCDDDFEDFYPPRRSHRRPSVSPVNVANLPPPSTGSLSPVNVANLPPPSGSPVNVENLPASGVAPTPANFAPGPAANAPAPSGSPAIAPGATATANAVSDGGAAQWIDAIQAMGHRLLKQTSAEF